MKTKEEAFIEFIEQDNIPRIPKIWFSKGWDAATANHDQEMVEFAEWAAYNWKKWGTYTEALTKFRQSKQ